MKKLLVWSLLPAFTIVLYSGQSEAAPGAKADPSAKAVLSTKDVKDVKGVKDAKELAPQKLERAVFALGCFWKSQHVFSKVPGVVRTRVGYSGGKPANPSYEQVCTHTTGHAEVVEVEFDPKKVSYEQLLKIFWSNHDPTTLNRQGVDIGDQYRSAVFYTTPEQLLEAIKVRKELTDAHKYMRPIVTDIKPAGPFYPAEDYHQDYFKKHGAACF